MNRVRLLPVLLPLVASWLMAASVPVITSAPGWHPQGQAPEIPFLLTPGASGLHVRSSVYYFIVVGALGAISILPIEVSKYLVGRRRSRAAFLLLLSHQLVTLADVLRANAWDWWLYLLSVMHLYRIDDSSWMERHWSLNGLWPWPSAISLVAVALILSRSESGPTIAAPEARA